MRVFLPRPGTLVVDYQDPQGNPIKEQIGPEWYRWFQLLWSSLGWNPSTVIHTDLQPSFTDYNSTAGLVVLDNGLTLRNFRNNNADAVVGGFTLPNHYQEGTDVVPYMVIVSGSTNTGDAELFFSYDTASVGGTVDGVQLTSLMTADGTDRKVFRQQFTAISGASLKRNSVVPFTAGRNGVSLADTLAGGVGFAAVGLKIQVQGSGQEALFA